MLTKLSINSSLSSLTLDKKVTLSFKYPAALPRGFFYSQLGGIWKGKKGGGYAEHIQRQLKIPIPVYRAEVAGHFNPTKFDADAWVRLAKNAGMGYLIITAKHHDGFAMWPSQVSDYNIAQATPFKRDPLRELKEACNKYGLKFGFYYSHAFDWGDAEGPGNDWDYKNPGGDLQLYGRRNWWVGHPELVAQARRYVDRKAIPQLRELIQNYHPDIFWFDTPHKLPDSENLRILKAVREMAPNIVINGRLVRERGDYASTADRPAEFPPQKDDWEAIPTTNESYGWNQNDLSHKSPSHFIQLLAKAAARGGNMLMNVGPRGDGTLDLPDAKILEGIGQWMNVNGESIHGTTRTPLPVQAWGESTCKGNTLYLHVFNWPRNGKLIVGGLQSVPRRAFLLAQKTPIALQQLNENDVLLSVPEAAPDTTDSVIALEFEGEIKTDARRLLSPTQNNVLRAFDGELNGKTLRFGAGKAQDAYLMNWSNAEEFISWPVRLTEETTFEVKLHYDAQAASAGSTYHIKIGPHALNGTVQAQQNKPLTQGRVRLLPGTFDIRIEAAEINGRELLKLRSLILTPVTGE